MPLGFYLQVFCLQFACSLRAPLGGVVVVKISKENSLVSNALKDQLDSVLGSYLRAVILQVIVVNYYQCSTYSLHVEYCDKSAKCLKGLQARLNLSTNYKAYLYYRVYLIHQHISLQVICYPYLPTKPQLLDYKDLVFSR